MIEYQNSLNINNFNYLYNGNCSGRSVVQLSQNTNELYETIILNNLMNVPRITEIINAPYNSLLPAPNVDLPNDYKCKFISFYQIVNAETESLFNITLPMIQVNLYKYYFLKEVLTKLQLPSTNSNIANLLVQLTLDVIGVDLLETVESHIVFEDALREPIDFQFMKQLILLLNVTVIFINQYENIIYNFNDSPLIVVKYSNNDISLLYANISNPTNVCN